MLNLILTIIQVLCGLAVIAVVMLQSGKSAGLSGAIAGGADTRSEERRVGKECRL